MDKELTKIIIIVLCLAWCISGCDYNSVDGELLERIAELEISVSNIEDELEISVSNIEDELYFPVGDWNTSITSSCGLTSYYYPSDQYISLSDAVDDILDHLELEYIVEPASSKKIMLKPAKEDESEW